MIAIILFHTANNYAVAANNRAPLYHYAGGLLIEQDKLCKTISEYGLGLNYFADTRYPALLAAALYPYYTIAGVTQLSLVMSNTLFLCLMLFSVYGIGKLVNSRDTGLLAAFILPAFPQIFGLSRHYDLRFQMAAVASASIYLLLKSDGLARYLYTFLFGLSVGIGISIKPEYSVYVIGPWAIIMLRSVAGKQHTRLTLLAGLLVCSLGLCAGLFANGGLDLQAIDHALFAMSPTDEARQVNPAYYIKSLIGIQALHFYSALFALSALYFIYRKHHNILLAWFAVPLLFFTFAAYRNLNIVFMTPALPAVSLMVSAFITGVKRKTAKRTLVSLAVLTGLAQILLISYFPESYPAISRINSFIGIEKIQLEQNQDILYYDSVHGSFPGHVRHIGYLHAFGSDWGINHVSELISNHSSRGPYVIVLDADIHHIISQPLGYKLYEHGITESKIIALEDSIFEGQIPENDSGTAPGSADFVVFTSRGSRLASIRELIKVTTRTYSPIGQATLPDGNVVFVHKKNDSGRTTYGLLS
ncbi:MAG: glycosyltransferase family 39 protein [archaeon]